jgi:hypothetical protein
MARRDGTLANLPREKFQRRIHFLFGTLAKRVSHSAVAPNVDVEIP